MAYALADRWPRDAAGVPRALLALRLPVAAAAAGDRRRGRRVQRPHGAARRGAGRRARARAPASADRHQAHVPARRDPLPPGRALLLGNYVSGRRRKLIEAAWGEAGVEVVTRRRPRHAGARPRRRDRGRRHRGRQGARDPRRDGVRARRLRARCRGGDGWVTEERYAAMEADNFAGHTTRLGPRSRPPRRRSRRLPTRRWARSTAISCSPTTTPPTMRRRSSRCSGGSRPRAEPASSAAARDRPPRPPAVGLRSGRDRAATGAARGARPGGRSPRNTRPPSWWSGSGSRRGRTAHSSRRRRRPRAVAGAMSSSSPPTARPASCWGRASSSPDDVVARRPRDHLRRHR